MSIPGLGQIPVQPEAAVASSRTVTLESGQEWRFRAPHDSQATVKLLSGTAEKDGTELAPGHIYTFSGVRSKILSWQRCELEIEGQLDYESTSGAGGFNRSANVAVNLHAQLNQRRENATRLGTEGPRILIAGPPSVGKSTLARTLTAYAIKQGYQPIVVNADPADGILTLPGTLSAAVFATVMDIEAVGEGWGGTPTSGPSTVPVKLPLVHCYGLRRPSDDADVYREMVSGLASAVSARLSGVEEVKRSGVIVDTWGLDEQESGDFACLAHIIEEMSINIVVVIGSPTLEQSMRSKFANETTSLGEEINIVQIEKPEGVAGPDEVFQQHAREQVIKEYFFGDARRTLSPQIQQMDFDGLVIYRTSGQGLGLKRETPSSVMQHWTLAIMNASPRDPSWTVRAASIIGFVYVSDVDEEKRKIKMLAPVSVRLGDRPLIWGRWPEPYMNLLG